MLFNSLQYLIFLPIVFALYWLFPVKYKWIILLISSYYFYASWNVRYLTLIVFITLVSFIVGLCINSCKNHKKLILSVGIIICIGVLFVFKYYDFFINSISPIFKWLNFDISFPILDVLLPVGISFYTFQAISYMIDVYNGTTNPEKNLGHYATFISFFPQLVAGPIERTNNLLHQIYEEHKFDYEQAVYGMRLMLWGYFKKIVIADNLSCFVKSVYNSPHQYKGFALIIATVFFTFQIYCDFSGYSDIAIGTARLFGIKLMRNFDSPYLSTSISEFWKRWHISLSQWFRDYVYIPLGGNRVTKRRNIINYMITFLLSGLWHGANFTFIIWGGIHGIVQVVERLLFSKNNNSNSIIKAIKICLVFSICSFAWIFFVSSSVNDALYVVSHSFIGIENPIKYIYSGFKAIKIKYHELALIMTSILMLIVFDFNSLRHDCIKWIDEQPFIVRHTITLIVLLVTISFSYGKKAEFVYFQF